MDVQKPYGQLMIGDLIGVLYKHHDPEVRKILGKIAEISNRLSHDSGTPIDLKMAQGLGALAKMYVTVLRLDVAAYPHSVRPSSP
jgi:hypothetical protein